MNQIARLQAIVVKTNFALTCNVFFLRLQVAMVWGFVGAIGTTIMIYILPPAFYLRVRIHPERPDLKQVAAWGLMLMGFGVLIVGTYQSFVNVIDPIPDLAHPYIVTNSTL